MLLDRDSPLPRRPPTSRRTVPEMSRPRISVLVRPFPHSRIVRHQRSRLIDRRLVVRPQRQRRTGRIKITMGVAQPKVSLERFRRIAIPLPPIEEQGEITRRVATLLRLGDAVEHRVRSATLRANKLTQSILAKAFRGELVPTEAELARREGRDYEPLSVLLERIKKEKASVDAIKTQTKLITPRTAKRRTV
jgi:hypothetical protein